MAERLDWTGVESTRLEDGSVRVRLETEGNLVISDRALLVDEINRLVRDEEIEHVRVDMAGILTLPTGTFALLMRKLDEGVRITLESPRSTIRNLLWFRWFTRQDADVLDWWHLADRDPS